MFYSLLLQVVTLEAKPFVHTRRVDDEGPCVIDKDRYELPCPHTNQTTSMLYIECTCRNVARCQI